MKYQYWLSENVKDFVVEPHEPVVGDIRRDIVLDITAIASEGCQKISTGLAKEEQRRLRKILRIILPIYQKSLQDWIPKAHAKEYEIDTFSLPSSLNWNVVKRAYDFQPNNYEELIDIPGLGPKMVGALALVSELVYREKPS